MEDLTIQQQGVPYCWEAGQYGNNEGTWARTEDPHSGNWAETLTISSLTSGDRKLMIRRDTGGCAPSVRPGAQYTLQAWYESTVATKFLVYYSDAKGHWRYWTSSPQTGPSTTWQEANWTTPPMPEDAVPISYGLQLAAVGRITTDDYVMTRADTHNWGAALVIVVTTILAFLIGVAAVSRRHGGR